MFTKKAFPRVVRYFIVPDILPRDFQQKGEQLFNDLQVVIKDSFERMSGYTYFSIIDLDEYLIPTRNRTLKELLVLSII